MQEVNDRNPQVKRRLIHTRRQGWKDVVDFPRAIAILLLKFSQAFSGLRVVNESWNDARDQLTLDLSGVAGKRYELSVWNPAQIASVKGGTLTKTGKLQVQMPAGPDGTYVPQRVLIQFPKR